MNGHELLISGQTGLKTDQKSCDLSGVSVFEVLTRRLSIPSRTRINTTATLIFQPSSTSIESLALGWFIEGTKSTSVYITEIMHGAEKYMCFE